MRSVARMRNFRAASTTRGTVKVLPPPRQCWVISLGYWPHAASNTQRLAGNNFSTNALGQASTGLARTSEANVSLPNPPFKKRCRTKGKGALQEHYECADFSVNGNHEFVDARYLADVAKHLHNPDLRLAMMDRNGVKISILSLTQQGIEAFTDAREAIEMAERMNNDAAEKYLEGTERVDRSGDRPAATREKGQVAQQVFQPQRIRCGHMPVFLGGDKVEKG
jgi:hypothetical protein